MNTKKTLIALSAAIVLGAIGATPTAQASDSGDYGGGFKIGPLGQHFGPVRGPAFGFAYSRRSHRHYERHRMAR
jgi:hypothetical protein